MQPYQHATAKANNGAVTLSTKKHYEQFIVLGSSCSTSATKDDGLLSSFTVVPKLQQEVVALVVVNTEENVISEVILLDVTLETNGKASVDLLAPFACSPHAVAQFLKKDGKQCQLRVMEKGETRLSPVWSLEDTKQSEAMAAQAQTVEFNELCSALVKIELPAVA